MIICIVTVVSLLLFDCDCQITGGRGGSFSHMPHSKIKKFKVGQGLRGVWCFLKNYCILLWIWNLPYGIIWYWLLQSYLYSPDTNLDRRLKGDSASGTCIVYSARWWSDDKKTVIWAWCDWVWPWYFSRQTRCCRDQYYKIQQPESDFCCLFSDYNFSSSQCQWPRDWEDLLSLSKL